MLAVLTPATLKIEEAVPADQEKSVPGAPLLAAALTVTYALEEVSIFAKLKEKLYEVRMSKVSPNHSLPDLSRLFASDS